MNKPKPESELCGNELLLPTENPDEVPCPIKCLAYHLFNDFVADLLSRPDIKKLIDSACNNVLASLNEPIPEYVKGFFDAKFVRHFEGPESTPSQRCLFIERHGEAHLFWVLNIDFFNPEGMHICGKMLQTQ